MSTYASEIRDAAYDLIVGTGAFKKSRKVPTFQWQPTDLPAIGIYVSRETMTAEGDDNAGEPRFVHDVTISFNVILSATSAEALETVIEAPVEVVLDTLLTNPDFMNRGTAALHEGVPTISRQTNFPTGSGEYLAEIRLDVGFRFRTSWPPVIPDAFKGLNEEIRPFGHGAETIPVQVHLDPEQ